MPQPWWTRTFSSTLARSTRPTFQRRINVVSTLWINVEITLIRSWKWNKIRRRIFNVAQRWYNVGVRRWNNVETTLIQLYLNFVPIVLDIGKSCIKTSRASDKYRLVNRQVSFILLNIFDNILAIQLIINYLTLTVIC